ncbi:MAG: Bro-N domain-containing protein [Candidatus Kapabacteria bacterium]|nr:Bro-N domain-containing protein [Candidatus Kapabacteria bacterium]
MKENNAIQIFEDKKVRTIWDGDLEKWFISIVDVIEVLTESPNPQVYWRVLKKRLKAEGNETVTNCNGLKMKAPDGKMRITDVADTEQLFRLIQSIPSPKAEPFKLWLAQIASERLDEMQDPELSIDRALEQYLKLGYSENWINQRLKSIEIRKELTDEWKKRGLKEGLQFATLTDIITKAWAGINTKEYKVLKGLKKENLRDNMTNTELILNMLAEASTKDISQAVNPETFEENKKVAKQGGNVAKVALKELEAKTKKKVVTSINARTNLQIKSNQNKNQLEKMLEKISEDNLHKEINFGKSVGNEIL